MARKLDTQRRPAMNLRMELKSVSKANEPSTLLDIVASKDGRVLVRYHRLADGKIDSQRWGVPQAAPVNPLVQAPVWLQWVAGANASSLFKVLALDRQTVSLARSERRILWVAGATAHQKKRPQIQNL